MFSWTNKSAGAFETFRIWEESTRTTNLFGTRKTDRTHCCVFTRSWGVRSRLDCPILFLHSFIQSLLKICMIQTRRDQNGYYSWWFFKIKLLNFFCIWHDFARELIDSNLKLDFYFQKASNLMPAFFSKLQSGCNRSSSTPFWEILCTFFFSFRNFSISEENTKKSSFFFINI